MDLANAQAPAAMEEAASSRASNCVGSDPMGPASASLAFPAPDAPALVLSGSGAGRPLEPHGICCCRFGSGPGFFGVVMEVAKSLPKDEKPVSLGRKWSGAPRVPLVRIDHDSLRGKRRRNAPVYRVSSVHVLDISCTVGTRRVRVRGFRESVRVKRIPLPRFGAHKIL